MRRQFDVEDFGEPASWEVAVDGHDVIPAISLPLVFLRVPRETRWVLASVRADCGKAFEPSPQIVGEQECPTATLHGAEFTSADCLIERRSSCARDVASLGNAVSKRCVHMSSPPIVQEWSRRPRPRHCGQLVESVTSPSKSGNRRKG